nr:hypothetical protein Itr_chr09CG12150 [Ipomoea trifida]
MRRSDNCQRDGKMGSVPEAGLAGAVLLQSSRWRVLRRNSKHQDLLSGRQHRNQNQGRPSIHQLSIFFPEVAARDESVRRRSGAGRGAGQLVEGGLVAARDEVKW